MNLGCDITKDLLPLYIENMISEEGRKSVDAHINQCPDCKKVMEEMLKPEPEQIHEVEQLKSFKKRFNRHGRNIVILAVFLTIAAVILVEGVFFMPHGQEMGYTIFYLYLLLPSVSLVCTCMLGRHKTKLKWLAPVVFGIVGMILPYTVFHTFDLIALWFAFIPSLVGLAIGLLYGFIVGKLRKDRERKDETGRNL